LVFLTIAVLFGPVVYSHLKPATIYVLVAFLGIIGTGLASVADGLELVWIGYSLVFGIANGLGYGFGLQFAARANPDHKGLAMGVVTAAYALGAVLAPYGFEVALAFGGLLFRHDDPRLGHFSDQHRCGLFSGAKWSSVF
jgi:OFA family oxalate/formate antiporter-like MFS transporter